MKILITYDISNDSNGHKRLRDIAKICVDYGTRVQYSVFECDLEPQQWVVLKAKLLNIYNKDKDSLRFYHLGSKWENKVEHFGVKSIPNYQKDPLIL